MMVGLAVFGPELVDCSSIGVNLEVGFVCNCEGHLPFYSLLFSNTFTDPFFLMLCIVAVFDLRCLQMLESTNPCGTHLCWFPYPLVPE